MKKNSLWFIVYGLWMSFLVTGFWLMVSLPACAAEEIGLVQKLWRKFFKRPAVSEKKIEKTVEEEIAAVKYAGEDTEGLTLEEEEARKDLARDLESQKEEREALENIRRAKEAQESRPAQVPRPPR